MNTPGDDVLPPDLGPDPAAAPPPPESAVPAGEPAPELPPPPPFYRRPAFQRTVVALGVLLFLFALGLLLPSPFWRF